ADFGRERAGAAGGGVLVAVADHYFLSSSGSWGRGVGPGVLVRIPNTGLTCRAGDANREFRKPPTPLLSARGERHYASAPRPRLRTGSCAGRRRGGRSAGRG